MFRTQSVDLKKCEKLGWQISNWTLSNLLVVARHKKRSISCHKWCDYKTLTEERWTMTDNAFDNHRSQTTKQ